MAAPKGNKNGIGNKGGRKSDAQTREKLTTFKGLVLDYAIQTMQGKDEFAKKQLVLRSINAIIPRELTGEDGGSIIVKWQK